MAVTVIKTYSRRKAAPKKSKTGLFLGISFIIIASGLGVYFWYKNKKEKEALLLNSATNTDSQNTTNVSTISTSTSPTIETTISTNTNPVAITANQPKDILDFQKWSNKFKGTNLVEDGLFTRKDGKPSATKLVWDKYGLEYTNLTSVKLQDLNTYLKANKNSIGKVVYSKYAGADIFDGLVADNVYNKITTTTKAQALGKVAKIIPATTGYWVVFSGNQGKFYKMYGSNLNILA
jgi:hypothetical protein